MLAPDRPHVLLIMTDQQRCDSVTAFSPGTRGPDGRSLTPNLDRLAGDGVIFTAAYSSTPTCTPARFALLTGRSPWSHGMLGYAGAVPAALPAGFSRMGAAMSANGYATAAFGKLHYAGTERHGFEYVDLFDGLGGCGSGPNQQASPGFGPGFATWFRKRFAGNHQTQSSAGAAAAMMARSSKVDCTGFSKNQLSWNSWEASPWPFEESTHPTVFVADRACAYLRRVARDEHKEPTSVRPVFVKVSFHRPHPPYDPPARLFDAFGTANTTLPAAVLATWATDWWPKRGPLRSDPRSPWTGVVRNAEAAASARRGYYASVSFVDEQLGLVLDDWRRLRHTDDGDADGLGGVVLFVSDHGEMLGDHLLFRKGYAYDPSARVPLILRWPAAFDAEHGGDRRITTPRGSAMGAAVELRDVLPTLLDAACGAAPRTRRTLSAARGGGLMDGRSLFELLRSPAVANRSVENHSDLTAEASAPAGLQPLELGEPAPPWRAWVDLEHDTVYHISNHWNALTDGRTKYIFHACAGREQLFDLVSDPLEMEDLASTPAHARALALWRSRLVAQFGAEGRGGRYVRDGRLLIRCGKDSHAKAPKKKKPQSLPPPADGRPRGRQQQQDPRGSRPSGRGARPASV